jgi:hypothetical protein
MVEAKGWLEAIKERGPIPQDAVEISQQLGDFLGKDLAKARLEKSMEVTKMEIRSAMVELAAVNTLRKKSEAERAQIEVNLASRTEEAGTRLEYLRQDFDSDFSDHLNHFRNTLKTGITGTINQFKTPLRSAPDLASLADRLTSMQTAIGPQIEAHFVDATRVLKRDLQSCHERFSRQIRSAIANINSDMLPDIGKDVVLPPIPTPVVVVLDYLLVIVASPLPIVADIILRMLADRFPEVRKIMPSGLAKSLALSWIEKQLDKQTAVTLDEIDRRIDSVRVEAGLAVGKSIQSLLEAEIAPLKRALQKADENKLPWSDGEITQFDQQLKALYARAIATAA